MTVAEGSGVYRYDGNDSATVFPFPEIFYANDDLTVILRTGGDGAAETVLVLDTDYTVTGAGTTSGSITYPITGDPLSAGPPIERLTIARTSTFERTSVLKNTFQFADWNLDIDKQETKLQELERDVARAVKIPISETGDPPTTNDILGGPGSDTTAIHDNLDGEINAITAKGTVVDADIALIEDSAASYAKKKTLFSTIWTYISGKATAAGFLQNVSEDTTPALGGTLNANDKDIDNAKTVTFNDEHDNGNSGATKTIDFGEGQKHKITMTANCTFTFTAPDGQGNFLFGLPQAQPRHYQRQ
jgi:hypothetical protein